MFSSFRSAVLALFFLAPQSHALFCNDEDREWCVEPRCSCEDVFPNLNSVTGFASESSLQTAICRQGFSGKQCGCGYSKTNIADNYLLFPDSLKGSLEVSTTASATGSILAGTWEAGYEASIDNPSVFTQVFGDEGSCTQFTENTWSIAKAANGNYIVGQEIPDGIRVKKPSDGEFNTVLQIGTLGGMVVRGNEVFAATFEGLYYSSDGGESWNRAPADCESYNWTDDAPDQFPPRPPSDAKYCEQHCSHVSLQDDGSVIAYYVGYAGAHRIQPGEDPLLAESWEALSSYQDSEACANIVLCHPVDSTVFGDHLYVTMLSSPMARMDLSTQAWEQVDVIAGSNTGYPAATTTANDGSRIFVSTDNGLYYSTDGVNWEQASFDSCWRRPPLAGRGMVSTTGSDGSTTIVWGSTEGPWLYKY